GGSPVVRVRSGRARARTYARIAETLAPEGVAGGVELRHEEVIVSRARQQPLAEVDDASKVASQKHVARPVHGNAEANLGARIAEALAPERVACGVELRHEEVIASRARQRSLAEVNRASKGSGQ